MSALNSASEQLLSLRQRIDQLDSHVLQLLAERFALVRQIGELKTDAAAIPAYERLLLMLRQRGEQAADLGLDRDLVVRLFEQIAHQAMAEQRQHRAVSKIDSTAACLPLVYSCSGCSSSAQLANDLALALDRERVAEMSCIAGVGGDVPALVKTASSGRAVLAIDGCSRHCARKCLQRHGVAVSQHVVLSKLGIGKRLHQHYRAEEMLQAKQQLIAIMQFDVPDEDAAV